MPVPMSDAKAPKRAVNVSINSDLLRQAREMKINLSRALEQGLEQLLICARHAVLHIHRAQDDWQLEGRGDSSEHRDVGEQLGVPDGGNARILLRLVVDHREDRILRREQGIGLGVADGRDI